MVGRRSREAFLQEGRQEGHRIPVLAVHQEAVHHNPAEVHHNPGQEGHRDLVGGHHSQEVADRPWEGHRNLVLVDQVLHSFQGGGHIPDREEVHHSLDQVGRRMAEAHHTAPWSAPAAAKS